MAEPLVFTEAGERSLAAAVGALDEGRLVVFPTDTVHGVAARPEIPGGTAAIFEAKARRRDLTLPVLVRDLDDVHDLADVDDRAAKLAGRFWPGGLTLVLNRTETSLAWDLGAERRTIAVRMPDHPVALDLLGETGPLATTSANLSGQPTPRTCDGVREALGAAVTVYLCAGPAPKGTASTVVDLSGGAPMVLREGSLPAREVLEGL